MVIPKKSSDAPNMKPNKVPSVSFMISLLLGLDTLFLYVVFGKAINMPVVFLALTLVISGVFNKYYKTRSSKNLKIQV